MPLEEALAQLGLAASALQLETETLNESIAAFDDRLAKIGAGVTVWLAREVPDQKEWVLGYARVDGKMTLAARQGEAAPLALAHAPRHVRVAAVALFEELVVALTARAREHAAEVRAATDQLLKGRH